MFLKKYLLQIQWVMILSLCLGYGSIVAAEEVPQSYTLGYGDRVSISVFGEDDLSVETQINDRGTISFPFLNEIQLIDLTVAEVKQKITQGLKEGYLVDPKVTVSVTEYRRFYVDGEVRQPGGFAFLPGLTVRKAISLSGGFTARAAQKKIYVVSDSDENKKPRKVDLDSPINPGDVITVKQRFF